MTARRTLVVMEGGHPWGFRIEGGAEVGEPIRINKVLGGGKAYCHGIEVGDILSGINGENASNMTISRARHLVRTSDDLLVLEVTRAGRDLLRIPEIRVISPNENLNTNGRGLQWGPNEVPDSQRYMMGRRSTTTEGGPIQTFTSKGPPVPPPKPARRLPLTTRNPLNPFDPAIFTYPVSPSETTPPHLMGHSRSPAVASGNASVVDDGTTWGQYQQPAGRKSTRSSTPIPDKPGKWTFTFYSPPTRPRSGEVPTQRRNTEPAPIKPSGLSRYLFAGKPGPVDGEPWETRKTDPSEGKEFRRHRTTDTGSVDRSPSSTAVVLPLSSTSRAAVSENQFVESNRFVAAENPYDLLPHQEMMLSLQGRKGPSVHFQNSRNNRNLGTPSTMPQLDKSWSKKIEDFETGYDSSTSHDDSNMYADYDYLPQKPAQHNNLRNSPRQQHVVFGDRPIFRDPFIAQRDHQLVFPDKRFGGVTTTRQRLDEENLRRKLEIERVIAEEKRRRYLKDLSDSTSRRHSDYFTPLQRPSLLMDRFSDDEVADALARPVKRVHTKIRGKARALHTFRAQSYRELPFKRNDIVYILRQVDKNWFEGERHGVVGIFPITYVEVLTSLDDARATAELREGKATAIYHFRAQTERELPLRKGDVVALIRRVDDNWYEGRLGKRQGIFPITYVETHREPETPMVTPMSSHAPTPLPGTPASCQSPVSSLYSVGPEIPSAPMSPVGSEFYESDWDTASISALQTGRQLRMTSPAHSQLSDREITPVRGVVSPFFIGAANRYPYEESRVQGRNLPPKPSMLPYSQTVDRDITPVRGVTSPTPTGSANARNSFDGTRMNIQSPSKQPKPSSLAYDEISDHEITPVREVTSPTPTGSSNARYSFDGVRITNQSPSVQPRPSSRAYNEIFDREITKVRGVTSPTPTGSENARYSLDGARIVNQSPRLQPKPASLAYDEISDHEITPVREINSPTPTGSANARYSFDGARIINQSPSIQPKPSSSLANTEISDRNNTPVRGVTSPTPTSSANSRYSLDRARFFNQSPSSQPKPSLLSFNQISDSEIMRVKGVTSPPPVRSPVEQYSDQSERRVMSPIPPLKPTLHSYNQISDSEILRVKEVTSPPPIRSPVAQCSDRVAPQSEQRVLSPTPPKKPALHSYNQISDRQNPPIKVVTASTPTGSGHSLDEEGLRLDRIIEQALQLKSSSLTSSQISDRDVTPIRRVTSPTPMDSATAEYSDRTAPQNGPRIQSADLQPKKPSTVPESKISDGKITSDRGVTSPTPMVSANTQSSSANTQISSANTQSSSANTQSSSANTQSSSDSTRIQRPSIPLKPSTLPQSQISDRDIPPAKAIACPAPSGSANVGFSLEDSKTQKPNLPAKPSMRPCSKATDQDTTPVRAVVSPTPAGSTSARLTSEDSKILNFDSPQTSAIPSELQPRKGESGVKENDKQSVSIEQTRGLGQGQGQVQSKEKSNGDSVDNSKSVKPVAATQRPPSGRSGSLTLKALKQKLPFFKQQQRPQPPPTESQERRDGFSKSPQTPNPYLRCRAVYDYKPQNIDELEVIRGDIIYVMEKCADGWFVGISDKTKKFGSFPGNFVRPAW